jgi:hypothetical protein
MKRNPHFRSQLAPLVLAVAALPALASTDCDAPASQWQSRETVRQMAVQQGWQVERLKIDDGCNEIRGTDVQGRRFKAKLDPETLQVLKIKQRERKERERRRERPPRDAGATPSSPLFNPGSAPRGQVQ